MDVAAVGSEHLLLLCQVLTVACDNALRVEHHDVLDLCTESNIEFGTADSSSTRTVYNNLYVLDVLASHFEGILQTGCRDDGSTVLVIVHDRDVKVLLQALLDIEALRCLDVLQVDTTECRSNTLNCFAEFLRVFLCQFDIENVDAAINLEKQSLAFHNWLSAHGANVAKTEHGSTVTNYCYQVTLVSILVCVIWVLLNLEARECYAWRVSKAQVCLCVVRFCRFYLNLTRTTILMIQKSRLFCDFYHNNILV